MAYTSLADLRTILSRRLRNTNGLWDTADLTAALQEAIRYYNDVGGFYEASDESLTTVADQLAYVLPPVITKREQVIKVEYRADDTEDWTNAQPFTLSVNAAGMPTDLPQVTLERATALDADQTLRVTYIGDIPIPSDDDDVVIGNQEFFLAMAAHIAHRQKAAKPGMQDRRFHDDEATANLKTVASLTLLIPRKPDPEGEPGLFT